MKIPDAYFGGGLGQRVPQPAGQAHLDHSGDEYLTRGMQMVGQSMLNIVTDRNEFNGRMELMQAQDQAQELRQLAREREDAFAKNEYLKFTPQLAELQQRIVNDPDIPPEQYPVKMHEAAQELASQTLYPKLNEHQQNMIVPVITNHINSAVDQIHQVAAKQIQDETWAEGQSTLDALKADPTRSTADKLRIIYDENLFTGSGRTPLQIQEAQGKAAQEVMTDDAAQRFNSTKQNLKSLQQFKADLHARGEDGTYRYLPGWDTTERERFISMAMAKEDTLLRQAEQDRKEAQREAKRIARENARDTISAYEELVKTGWQPNTAKDYQLVNQARTAASQSPGLAMRYRNATSYITDLDKRAELYRRDPLGVKAREKGVVIPPLNVFDLASLPQQLHQRDAICKKYGFKERLLGQEIKALSEYLQTLSPRSQVQMMNSISQPLGRALSTSTWSAAAEQVRQDHPEQAAMFKLYASGKPSEAMLYAEGRAFLNGERKDLLKDKISAVQRDASGQIDTFLGTALAGLPKTRNEVKDTIATVYLAEATRRNTGLDRVDKDLLRDVTNRVAGQTVRTGGSYTGSGKTTIVPDGMSSDQFLNSIKSITPQDIRRRGGVDGMSDADAAAYIKDRAWHESAGGYTFTRDGSVLYGKDGRPFVFRFDDGVGSR